MSFASIFPDTPEGVTQLRVLNACVEVASSELTAWQKLTKITTVTDKRIRFSIDQVYARLTGLNITTVLYTLQELDNMFGFIDGTDDGNAYEFLRLTPHLFAVSNQETAEAVPA